MSRRSVPRRTSALVVEELEDSDYEEKPQRKQRPSGKGTAKNDDVDEDYITGEEEDDLLEEEVEDDDDDDQGEEEEEEIIPRSRGGKKRGSTAGGGRATAKPAKRARQPAATAAAAAAAQHDADEEADFSNGPLVVTPAAIQRAEQKIIKYSNEAEAHLEASRSNSTITTQGITALVRLVVRHVIFTNSERPGVPITRAEVLKLISENSAATSSFQKRQQGLPALILAIAQSKLADIFGIEMVELTKPSAARAKANTAAAAASTDGSKHFVLRSIVPPVLYSAVVEQSSGTAAASRGFLTVILSIIQMSGGSIEEKELWKHLGDLGVVKTHSHPSLATPSALVDGFIKKRYLHVDRVAGSDGAEFYYSIAENAADEVGEERLKKFYTAEFGSRV